jgi:uncharacterized protein
MPLKVVPRKSGLHGMGLFATRDLAAGERLIEYNGKRYEKGTLPVMEVEGITKFLGLSDGTGIDGSGWASLANHGCEPNCELREHEGKGKLRAWLYASSEVKQGEELVWDYRLIVKSRKEAYSVWACTCGADTCRGTMANPDLFRRARDKATKNTR